MKKYKREDYSYPVTEEDIEFDNLCDEYRERFGKGYGVNFGDSRPCSEHIEIMKEALRTGVPAEIPELICAEGVAI